MPLDRRKIYRIIGKELRNNQYIHVSDAVVEQVIGHRNQFIADIMRDPKDRRPIRLRYLGTFLLRKDAIKK
jgi:hypothetical protein